MLEGETIFGKFNIARRSESRRSKSKNFNAGEKLSISKHAYSLGRGFVGGFV
jgi:hypothetical protein